MMQQGLWPSGARCPAERPSVRRFQTLQQMFEELNRASPHKSSTGGPRRPVLLLLGGGMAAGKSTVREIIGQDNFWSKVRLPCGPLHENTGI